MSKDGLVAPVWSDSGEAPAGELTCIRLDFAAPMDFGTAPAGYVSPEPVEFYTKCLGLRIFDVPCRFDLRPAKPSDPNAKPALSALSKVAGESYRGLGWCDES